MSGSLAKRAYDASWGRLFAAVYDRSLAATEEAGLGDRRGALLAGAGGRTLEIGAGTGINLERYPDAVSELILTEPFEPMARRLRERVATAGREAQVVVTPADQLPVEDGSIDTVVVTLVFCTVGDLPATLDEVARVLKPGGRLLFIEHVRSDDPRAARKQDRYERPWRFVAHGCHPNRDTVAAIEASPLQMAELEHGRMPKSPQLVKPLIQGVAVKPG